MSFADKEVSIEAGEPYELYLFQTEQDTYRLTSADEDKLFLGGTYVRTPVSRSEITDDQEQHRGQVKVNLSPEHAICQQFVAYLPASPMALTIYRQQTGEIDAEAKVIFSGKVYLCNFQDPCEIVCVPDTDQLKKVVPGSQFQSQCNRVLYDAGCTVDREDFKRTITLSSVAVDVLVSSDFAAEIDGWFQNGYVDFNGQKRMILSHVGDTVTLLAGIAGLEAGDVVFGYAGCNHQYNGDCVAKFDNGANFFGFQWIPTKNPFGTSLT